MDEYAVRWDIEIFADSPEDAARKALEIQRDPSSIATVFEVAPCGRDGKGGKFQRIDLDEIDQRFDAIG